jgi:hypothetical protein
MYFGRCKLPPEPCSGNAARPGFLSHRGDRRYFLRLELM